MNRDFLKIEFSADQVSVATNPYAAGLPSLTAIAGMVEALQVMLVKQSGTEVFCDSFAFGLRDCQTSFSGGGRYSAYEKSDKGKSKPKEDFPVPSVNSEPDVKAYLEAVLWIDIRSQIAGVDMKDVVHNAINSLRFSGGMINPMSVFVSREASVEGGDTADDDFAAYLQDYLRSRPYKGPVYLYADRLDAMTLPDETPNQSRLIEFLRFLAKRHRKNEDKEDKHAYEGEYLGHMVALHGGYRLLEDPVSREGTRLADDIEKIIEEGRYDPLTMKADDTLHAFAESTLSLVGLTSYRRLKFSHDEAMRCIWAHKWYGDKEYQVRSVNNH